MRVFTHGLGGAKDLPVPVSFVVVAAMAALVVSFALLIWAWRQPKFDAAAQGRPLPARLSRVIDARATRAVLRVVGLVITGWLAWATISGPDTLTNPIFGSFYVLLWVGIVPASLLFGPAYRLVSPVRTLNIGFARVTGGHPGTGILTYPARLGYWPAAATILGFVWMELVNPQADFLGPVRIWLASYTGLTLVGAAIFGDAWLAHADPFEVYSTLLGKLCPVGRRPTEIGGDGRLVLRNPLVGLTAIRPEPGLVAALAVLFGSTAFDSYKDKLSYVAWVGRQSINPEILNTLVLLAVCVVIGVTFTIASMSTGVDPGESHRPLPNRLAPAVVPIVAGYMTAHYLSYFVEQGQATLPQLSDPMADGSDYLGLAGWQVDYWLSLHPTVLAWIKVGAVVVGHILGATAAHDSVLRLLPARHKITGQLGMLLVMVAYTGLGLYLLFGT